MLKHPMGLDLYIVFFMIVKVNFMRITSTKGPVGQDFGIIWLRVTWWIECLIKLIVARKESPKDPMDRILESADLESGDDCMSWTILTKS